MISKNNRIKISQEDLSEFCQRYHIRKLSLFGSVLKENFKKNSDIDILVEFAPGHTIGLIRLSKIERELSQLLERKVDMRTAADLSHYFREEVLKSAEVQYAEE